MPETYEKYSVEYRFGNGGGTSATPVTRDPKEAGKAYRHVRGQCDAPGDRAKLQKRTVTKGDWETLEGCEVV